MMDTSKLTSKVSKILLEVITTHTTEHTNQLLKAIALQYEIDESELIEKYGTFALNIEISKNKKKQSNGSGDPSNTEPKKRGRKKKHREELIETEEFEYNGIVYLVDTQNNVYTYNVEQPVFVGTKLIDGRVKFLQSNNK
jgi:hypothetical protein